ncbi:Autotransporter beta- domain protein [Niastella koreensis GR20-10]|uniref:Autotransporter beta-domain protein n=2 Tax=Niastella koreensis TaxID=354356 RepID=G8TMJ6_NIAKG|nr:outer membrane beta-barrel protein [Niastella koreensis]AEW01984.1 Autotransporter beta- domain protein [Niastella koreensis GR20-10]
MKQRIVLSLVFVCAFMVTTRAQISKGAVWVGGSIGYNQTKQDPGIYNGKPYKTTTLTINPSIGTAVKDNLVVGIELLYNQIKTENDGNSVKSKTNAYGGGVFVRKYFPVITRLYIFGDANAAYAATKNDRTLSTGTNPIVVTAKGGITSVGITPGIAFAVSKKFMLETSLNNLFSVAYTSTKTTGPTDYYKSKSSQFAAGVFADGKAQFNIGVRFLLGNKG